ncbi:hypothetical protein ACFOGI_15685 [Virgibacillus xinjiangensis]|uniref:Uncharacterized protein n=1 Tax=Virgibacillus xinjiangensis TaxID=393090 RepID=A0ABV7CZ29_9BACI
MSGKDERCRACEGTGMLADDEGWQYTCSICRGDGSYSQDDAAKGARIMEVDETNRLLD